MNYWTVGSKRFRLPSWSTSPKRRNDLEFSMTQQPPWPGCLDRFSTGPQAPLATGRKLCMAAKLGFSAPTEPRSAWHLENGVTGCVAMAWEDTCRGLSGGQWTPFQFFVEQKSWIQSTKQGSKSERMLGTRLSITWAKEHSPGQGRHLIFIYQP